MKKFLLFVLFLGVFVSFLPTLICAQETDKIAPNKEFYKGIDDFIKKEITKSNAEPAKGRYNFIVALSTSHFSSDQRNVVAMKQAAYLIANNFCTVGDSLTSVSWELDVWNMSDKFILSADGIERKQFVNSLPKTPMDKTKGGHDTYRALMTILQKIENPESSIIILITNSHESRGPMGEKYSVVGQNSTELKSLLEQKGFRVPEDASFSFLFEDDDKPADIFITLALPKNLKSVDGNLEDRTPAFTYSSWFPEENKPSLDVLPEPVKEDTASTDVTSTDKNNETQTTKDEKEQKNKGELPMVPIIIGGLVVIGGIVFALIPKSKDGNKKAKKGKTHKIEFNFAEKDYAEEIEEGKITEMLFLEDSFFMKVKGEENPEEPTPEEAKSVFEVSYSVKDDSFIFEFIEANMSTDPSELTDFQQLNDKKYIVKNGVAVSCSIDFDGNEHNLIIG